MKNTGLYGATCYTLNKSSNWYTGLICMVFQKIIVVVKFYPYFDYEYIKKIHNYVFGHFKSSCR